MMMEKLPSKKTNNVGNRIERNIKTQKFEETLYEQKYKRSKEHNSCKSSSCLIKKEGIQLPTPVI
jgi:hypothetical protein